MDENLSGDLFRAADPEARASVGVDLFAFEAWPERREALLKAFYPDNPAIAPGTTAAEARARVVAMEALILRPQPQAAASFAAQPNWQPSACRTAVILPFPRERNTAALI